MKELRKKNLNTPELANELFEKRWRKQLHYIDWLRFKKLVQYYQGGRYLDIGCFNTPIMLELKRDFPNEEFYGLDHANKVINYLQKQFPDINYVLGDVMKLPFENEFFNYVVMGELIEHMESPAELLKEAFRVLKRGGMLALSTPDSEEIHNPLVSEEHLWAFTEEDIKELLGIYGKVEVIKFKDTVNNLIAFVQKV